MALKLSSALCNMLLGGVTGAGSLKDIADGEFKLFVYNGPVPATADTALFDNTLLCTVSNGGSEVTLGTASGGAIEKTGTETWSGTNVASGVATFYRFQKTGDAGGTGDGTTPRIQGLVATSATAVAGDLIVTTTTLLDGEGFEVEEFKLNLPPT